MKQGSLDRGRVGAPQPQIHHTHIHPLGLHPLVDGFVIDLDATNK